MIVPVAMGDHHRGDFERERNKPWRFHVIGWSIRLGGSSDSRGMESFLYARVIVCVYICMILDA